MPKTSRGRPVTEAKIDELAHQAEAGYDVERLKRTPGRRPIGSSAARVFPVRLDPELESALRSRAKADHRTSSDVIRDALRAWLKSA